MQHDRKILKEACVEGFVQALRAQELGADRIELCENLALGGTTPSLGTLIACKKHLTIPVIAMIRPRGGNFVYNAIEHEIMAEDIRAFRDAGADGIAIGLLNNLGEVEVDPLGKLLKHAGEMEVTFHKAIDVSTDILRETERLCQSGLVKRILSSGGADTAIEGAEILRKMMAVAKGKICILVAGKVTDQNLEDIRMRVPAKEFHGKKIVGLLNG
ncbi:MAG: copper homeostasis protein CutC [Bacteroidales bacterium]|nr:copper homeostasis protein CutC [Bacteroidales bacterium]